jgi:hypothetical protein
MVDEQRDDGTEHSDLETQRLREAFTELRKEYQEIGRSLEPYIERRLRALAGSRLDEMLASAEETVKDLTNPNPGIREVAVQLAYRHWGLTTLASVYEQMARSDPSQEVKETAIRAVGTCYARTKNPRIGRLLAEIVRDPELILGIRLTAFVSLLRVHRNLDYTGKSPLVPVCLEDIDWEFVDAYYCGLYEILLPF